jgi:hypothetical protein
LRAHGVDVKLAPRSTPDARIAALSLKEARVVVTNDWDLCQYGSNEVCAVVWLRIPQDDPESLISSFRKLLAEAKAFTGQLFIVRVGAWRSLPLPLRVVVRAR